MTDSKQTKEPADYQTKGGRLPHGTELQASYAGQKFKAKIRDGEVLMRGTTYSSLSNAAVAAKRSTGADIETSNGWRFWNRRDPEDDEWKSCAELRDRG